MENQERNEVLANNQSIRLIYYNRRWKATNPDVLPGHEHEIKNGWGYTPEEALEDLAKHITLD